MESVLYTFEDNYGHKHYLTNEISRGGQGAVFRTTDANIAVKLSLENDQPVMDDSENDVFNKIRLLPFVKNLNITLPRALLNGASGYVMDLLADMNSFSKLFSTDRYEPLHTEWIDSMAAQNPKYMDVLARYAASGGSRRRLELYLGFAGALAKLHCSGLVFCDVSPNNVFGSTRSDRRNVWLIDSDNVNYQAITIRGKGTCYTPGYAAPEVLETFESSMYSDSYAFMVCLFYDITLVHPFMGKRFAELCEEEDAEYADMQLYGGYEPWILDCENDANRGDTTVPVNIILSDGLLGCMQRMFSEMGRTDVMTRPTMPEIGMHIAKNLDVTVTCPHCGMSGIYDGKCRWCDEKSDVIYLNSYHSHGGVKTAPLWECVCSITDNGVDVPMRLAEGYRPDNTDKSLFRASLRGGSVVISNVCSDAVMYVMEKGAAPKLIYGSYAPSGRKFSVMLRMCTTGMEIIIEGSV